MDYWKSGRYFGVTRHDTFLAVAVVQYVPLAASIVVTLPPVYSFGNKLDASKVLDAVQTGIERANNTFHTHYHVTHIQYVEDDPDETFYAEMVFTLIEQLAMGAVLREIEYKYSDV